MRASRLLLTRANALTPRKVDRAPEADGLQLASSFASKLAQWAALFGAAAVYQELALKQPLQAQMQAQAQVQQAQMQAQAQVQQAQMQAQAQILQEMVTKLDEVPRLAGISERLNNDFNIILGKKL